MGRRSVALALALLPAWGLLAAAARAEESGKWEAERRAGLGAEIRPALEDLFSQPRLSWDRGPVLETRNKALAIHVGYEGQFDAVWYHGMDEAVEAAAQVKWISGYETRRSRLKLETFFLRHGYVRVRYGWAGGTQLQFQDLFLEWSGLTRLPGDWWPIVRVGQIKEPMTIDWMTSAFRTTFAERAMFTTTIVPNRNLGIRVHGTGPRQRFTYQLGTYLLDLEHLSDQKEGRGASVTGRLTGLPWAPADRPHHLLHVGVAASARWHVQELEYAAKPESWLGPPVIKTGAIDADRSVVLVGEVFHQRDRLSFAAEGAWTRVEVAGHGPADFWGFYGQVSYFLTPGRIRYYRTLGCYGRVQPERMLFCPARRGLGDLEVAARWSILDLGAGPVPGGRAWNLTVALNWYARDNLRVQLDYIYTDVSDAYGTAGADGTMNAVVVRLAYDL